MRTRWLRLAPTAFAGFALAAGAARGDGCNWPMYGHDPGHSFAQPAACAQITASNAALLTEKWFFSTGTYAITASPSVVNGVAYVGDSGGVFHAIDVRTGAQLWSYQIDDQQGVAFGRITSSAAVDTMRVGASAIRVVAFGGGGTLYVLNPVDGALLAKQDLDPRAVPQDDAEAEVESSPVIAHLASGLDRILVGNDVHNDAHIGRTGLHAFALVPAESGPTPYRLELVTSSIPRRAPCARRSATARVRAAAAAASGRRPCSTRPRSTVTGW
jgi:outer membrane protein assembly factor BamB